MIVDTIFELIVFLLILTFIPMLAVIIICIISAVKKLSRNVEVCSKIIKIWLLLVGSCLLYGFYCEKIYNNRETIKKETGIDVKSCKLIDKYADGIRNAELLIRLDCSNSKEQIEKQMKKNNKLPLSSNLPDLSYVDYKQKELSNVKKGYYYFKYKNQMIINDIETHDGFILVIYDSDSSNLYYYEVD